MNEKTNCDYNNNITEYKTFAYSCAGLNCSSKPNHKLKIKYINKTGYFCQRCSEDLLKSELAEEIPTGEIQNA
jgi:predicted SprT family Zn-dependent metalloprotease